MYRLTAALGLCASGALADVPRVAVDIAPVHSIVAAVMGDLGQPDLISPPGASPHDHTMRPSEARMLERADIVFWMGDALTLWLQDPMQALAGDALQVALLDEPRTQLLSVREGDAFGHSDHEDHGGHSGEGHGDHAHVSDQGIDPHAWLDPRNGAAWAEVIADTLAAQDPQNAHTYQSNATAFQQEINRLEIEIDAVLAPVRGRPFVVFHDAFHYFEHRFDIEAIGAISANNAEAPSAGRVSALRDDIAAFDAICALTEPQFNPGIVAALGDVRLGELDPMGMTLEPGPQLYPQLLGNISTSLYNCLK